MTHPYTVTLFYFCRWIALIPNLQSVFRKHIYLIRDTHKYPNSLNLFCCFYVC